MATARKIQSELNRLLKLARDEGYSVTMIQRPVKPLPMIRYKVSISVRQTRVSEPTK